MNEEPFKIGFLDDRREPRETVLNGLRPFVPAGWQLVACPLLERVDQYPQWLLNNRILALVVDQLLNEQAEDSQLPVDYKGHDVILAIRRKLPTFPIMIVSRAMDDHELLQHRGDAEAAIPRAELVENGKEHVQRLIRLANKYLDEHEKELALLADLSQKVASGQSNDDDIDKLHAVQAKLGVSLIDAGDRDIALSQLEREVTKLEELHKRATSVLKKVASSAKIKKARKKKK